MKSPPECPECETILTYKDYYGKILGWNRLLNEPNIEHHGDIWYCEKCEKNYYDEGDDVLTAGYPC